MKTRALTTLILSIAVGLTACSSQKVTPQLSQSNPANTHSNACVVLVHGLWRSGFAMRSIANHLEAQGYTTYSVDYPSTSMEIPVLAQRYIPEGIQHCEKEGASQIHFVTHSMGGILVRQYLQEHSLPNGSRVVMLSPPNRGAQLSETFGDQWWYQWIVGPAGASLTKKESGIINQLKEISPQVGIIAAYRTWSIWPESWLAKPNDGTIAVSNMMLPEMDDFILVNSGHAMMRFNDDIQNQIAHFLDHGQFQHNTQVSSVKHESRAPLSRNIALSPAQ